MNAPARNGLRMTWRALWYALAAALVLMALGAVVASRLLPMLERNPERVEAWLGERIGHPVAFDALETAWTRRGPLLRLDGMRVGHGSDAITIGAAEVLVAQYAGLLPGRSLTELRLRNLELVLERDDQGRWHARGLPGQEAGGDPFAALERLGELQVLGASLTIEAPTLDFRATVPRIDVRLQVSGDRVRAATRAWMHTDDVPLLGAVRLDRGSGEGELYAGFDDGDLGGWEPLLRFAGVAVDDGRGRAEAWVELRDSRVQGVAARLDLEGVGLRALATGDDPPRRVGFDLLQGQFQWAWAPDGWRLDVPRLHVADGDVDWHTGRLTAVVGSRYALVADRAEAAPLLAVLALSNRVAPGLGAWLGEAGANAVLEDVELAGLRDGPMQGRARVESLVFDPVGDRPGLYGLRGELVGDEAGLVFDFDPQAPLRVDWPSGFGTVHQVTLAGAVSAWGDGEGWQVQAPALRVDGDGYGAQMRGGLMFQGDGTRPRIDMALRLDETRVPVAKRFWVHYLMSDQAVEWLDEALVDGRVVNGVAVVSGDLDDWPFDASPGSTAPGLFHAEAELADATLRFQPDWPEAEGLHGQVRFIANGFDFSGRGEIAGVPVEQLEAGIADFDHSELAISTSIAADAGHVIALLQDSPLSVDALRGLQADGPMEGTFAMRLPLHGDGDGPGIEGVARLAGVQAAMPEWELALQDLRGDLAYDEHGFSARSIQARLDGRPGLLSLRAGEGHVAGPGHTFEGELRAGLDAAELLARAPGLDWLQPHLRGRSSWTVGVAVSGPGDERQAGSAVLSLQSDLVGTTLELPRPLAKPAVVALPARVRIPLPLDNREVDVRLGQRLSLRARAGDGEPAVRVVLGGAAAAAPSTGLVIEGRTPELAALEWAGLVGAAGTGSDDHADAGQDADPGDEEAGLALREIDLQVDHLLLGGGSFGSVHVGTLAGDDNTRLQFEGDALAGHVVLPGAAQARLAGHFERLHWYRKDAGQTGTGDNDGDGEVLQEPGPDPALIPPIRLSVGDLRLDQTELGNATLATSRIQGGMRIEQVEAQSSSHHVVASGEWTGRGAQARTRMDMRVASGNFGLLLDGLGYNGHMRGGDGRLQLAAAWAGSPAGFRTDLLDGELQLALSDGQLVEMEPGAGRLLGLLSVAELPRRLSLDFRDFFDRGFAFNRIQGDIAVVSGRARSDNLLMDGPAATIHIAGQADLRARTYDQTIEVLPKSGNVLTAVGAIAGGPVGAAVGAMANAVLRKPLSELGSTTYRVTGPWQEPQVEVVRRIPPQVAEGEPPPGP